MSRRKTKSVVDASKILFTPIGSDREVLSFFEEKVARESGRSRIEVPDAEVIRRAIKAGYEAERRRRGGKSDRG